MRRLLFFILLILSSVQMILAAPTVSGFDNKTIAVNNPASIYDMDITINNNGSGGYSGGYIRFSIESPNSGDNFALTSDSDPNIEGNITVSNSEVYLGTGSDKVSIGFVDLIENGVDGNPLKINLSEPLGTNGGFELGNTTTWDVSEFEYTGITSGSIDYEIFGGHVENIPVEFATSGTGSIIKGTEFTNFVGGEPSWYTDLANGPMQFNVNINSDQHSSGEYSLRLFSYGWLQYGGGTGDFAGTGNLSIHGPSVLSSEFEAEIGDRIYLDWMADGTEDCFEVFGYLHGAGADEIWGNGDDTKEQLFAKRGDITEGWATEDLTISQQGKYKFEFIGGTYDGTGKYRVGSVLFIDNIRIIRSGYLEDSVVKHIAELVEYHNDDAGSAPSTRDVTLSVKGFNETIGSDISVLQINSNNVAPTITSQGTLVTNKDENLQVTFSDLSVTDPDSNYPDDFVSLTLSGGSNYTITGVNNDIIVPANGFIGILTVAVVVNDGVDDSNSFDLTVTVNDIPLIGGQVTTPQILEGASHTLSLDDLNVTDSDSNYPDDFTLIIENDPAYTVDGFNVTASNENFNGNLIVKIKVSDGYGTSEVYNYQITVNPVNDPPTYTSPPTITPATRIGDKVDAFKGEWEDIDNN